MTCRGPHPRFGTSGRHPATLSPSLTRSAGSLPVNQAGQRSTTSLPAPHRPFVRIRAEEHRGDQEQRHEPDRPGERRGERLPGRGDSRREHPDEEPGEQGQSEQPDEGSGPSTAAASTDRSSRSRGRRRPSPGVADPEPPCRAGRWICGARRSASRLPGAVAADQGRPPRPPGYRGPPTAVGAGADAARPRRADRCGPAPERRIESVQDVRMMVPGKVGLTERP